MKNGTRRAPWVRFLKGLGENIVCNLRWRDFLIGTVVALLLSAVMVTYKFQQFPIYKVGDIAESDLKSPQELWLVDAVATEAKREQVRTSVPVVFDYDLTLWAGVESEIHAAFTFGRELVEAYETRGRVQLPDRLDIRRHKTLWEEVLQATAGVPDEDVLRVFYQQRFSETLEGKLISIYRDAVRPGVVASRDALVRFQPQGIVTKDVETGEEKPLTDIYVIKDISQARGIVRQHQLDLSELNVADRRIVIAYLEEKVIPNLAFNRRETERRRAEAVARVEPVQQRIKPGRVIIREGDEVTESTFSIIEELRKRTQPKEVVSRYVGIYLLMCMLLYAVWRYFNRLQARHRNIRNHFILFSVVMLVSLVLSRLLFGLCDLVSENLAIPSLRDPVNLYYSIPFVFGCILVTLLIDTNIAILFLSLLSVTIGIYSGNIYLTSYVVIGGFAAIYGAKQYRDRSTILKAGLTIGVVNTIAIVALDQLITTTPAANSLAIKAIGGFMSGIMAAMIASLFLPLLESLFNITTDIRLLELSNLDSPILRRMAVEAPGTYHHSIVMGTLAESAAEAIGANSLLVRVGAYYHDIGKISKPAYFVENQVYLQNKHESLSPHMSCLVIGSHVKDGLEMAKQLQLPTRIRDMIPQHHGTRVMTYFYQKAKSSPQIHGQDIKESDFRYPGPKPQSKEAAILMIADAVEAASRTLTEPTPAQIQGMVKRLINTIVADGQFDECDITLKDLDLIAQSFFKVLAGMFHHRISYPGYDFNKTESENTAANVPTHAGIQ